MIRDLADRCMRLSPLLGIGVALLTFSAPVARADVGGRGFVVAVSGTDDTSLEADIAEAAEHGATGVLVTLSRASTEATEPIRRVCPLAERRDLELWIGIGPPWETASKRVEHFADEPITGIALVGPSPLGEPREPGDLAAQMEIKHRGELLGQTVRRVKAGLRENWKLVVSAAASEIDPETVRDRYVPVGDLIRDGTLDGVCLAGAERMNFHRLRLLRDTPLSVGIFLNGDALEQRQRTGLLERGALAAVDNTTCDSLWLSGFPTSLAAQVVPQAVERRELAIARRKTLEEAVRRGTLTVDQEVSEEGCNDQATVHGVAQSFMPSRDAACPLVQIYVAIRGCSGPLPPPLEVEIREDDGGKLGQAATAKTEIPATEFGHEPTYRWGAAHFDPPVALRHGTKYWIYLPNARHPEGSFVWRVVKDGADARGSAWSRSYDYGNHTWVFRVFLTKKD
jgi:hypothetical protein